MADAQSPLILSEAQYKPDFELLDRYQSFSAEVLRLSLVGLGAVGLLLTLDDTAVAIDRVQKLLNDPHGRYALTAAAMMFTLSAAVSLAHRGISSDSMHFHLRILRGSTKDRDVTMRDALLRLSEWAMIFAPVLLALAVLALGYALIFALN